MVSLCEPGAKRDCFRLCRSLFRARRAPCQSCWFAIGMGRSHDALGMDMALRWTGRATCSCRTSATTASAKARPFTPGSRWDLAERTCKYPGRRFIRAGNFRRRPTCRVGGLAPTGSRCPVQPPTRRCPSRLIPPARVCSTGCITSKPKKAVQATDCIE
jgi:hypothetical protein